MMGINMEKTNSLELSKAKGYAHLLEAKTEAQMLIERLDVIIADLVMINNESQLDEFLNRYTDKFLFAGLKHIRLD